MKKRIFAVIGIVLMLVPLCILGVSADESGNVANVTSTEDAPVLPVIPEFSIGDIMGKVPGGYNTLTDYTLDRYGSQENALGYLLDNYQSIGGDLDKVHTLFYTTGDDENLLSQGDLLKLSRKYIRLMGEGYTDNLRLGSGVIWSFRIRSESIYDGSIRVFDWIGMGDVYVTYKTNGTSDICFFNKTSVGDYTRVRIVYGGSDCPDETESNGDMIDVLKLYRLEFTDRSGYTTTVAGKYNAKVDVIDVAMGFSDEGYYANSYYLTKLLIPYDADPALQFADFAYVREEWELCRYMYSFAYGAMLDGINQATDYGYAKGYNEGYPVGEGVGYNTGYDKGYDDGHSDGYTGGEESGYYNGYENGYNNGYDNGFVEGLENGEEQGYDSGYYYGLADGKIKGEAIGYDKGYVDGEHDGMKAGLERGWDEGHETGYIEGAQYSTDMGSMFFSILESPIVLIDGMLNFDLFGINVAGLVKTLLTLSITAVIVFFIFKLVKG